MERGDSPSRMRVGDASVVVVVPRYTSSLKEEERISLKHLHHYLGHYNKYYACPSSLQLADPDLPLQHFDDSYFQDIAGYNRLMLSPTFYQTFAAWDYILIYQLDCLVFSDQLSQWCARGYDYIGSPWLKSIDEPEKGFAGVGNGGLSLRRVSTFLKVIENSNNPFRVLMNALRITGQNSPRTPRNLLRWLNKLYRRPARFQSNEDGFWSKAAANHYPAFSTAPVDVALAFAFECAPEYCFEMNNRQLPFGCHAWAKYNKAFWEPYLLSSEPAIELS
jgi:hypothetical protein